MDSRLHRFLEKLNDYRGVIAFVVVFVLGVIFSPRALDTGMPIFLSWQTQLAILYEYSEYGLLATGMTLVILTGGIDLSVGSVLGLSAVLFFPADHRLRMECGACHRGGAGYWSGLRSY